MVYAGGLELADRKTGELKVIDETKLLKFLASEIKAIDDLERSQHQTGEITEMLTASVKRKLYQELLDRIISDEFTSEKN